jgi:hypothetical protein
MVYKGEDLELITPDEWSGARAGWGASRSSGRGPANERDLTPDWLDRALVPQQGGTALWVDATVLACCNKAYDLAVVHHAGEVGLEHLVHAMTLDVDAIDVLRSYNIDVTSLRSESAARLAQGRRSWTANRGTSLPNSADFNGILTRAADHAYDEGQPVTIAHILEAMLAMNSNINQPTVQNLLKNNPSLRYGAAQNANPTMGNQAVPNGVANGVAANPIMTQLGETFYALLNDPNTRGEALTLLGTAFGTNLAAAAGGAGQVGSTGQIADAGQTGNTVQPGGTAAGAAVNTGHTGSPSSTLDPALVTMLNSIRDKVVELKTDDDKQQSVLEAKWNDTVNSLSNSFDTLSTAVMSKLGNLDAATLASLQTVVNDLKQLDLDKKLAGLETSLVTKIGALTPTDVSDLKTRIAELKSALAAAPATSVSLTGIETKLDSVLHKVKDLDDLDDKFDTHVTAVKTLLAGFQSSDLAELKSTIEGLKTTINSSPSSSIEVAQLKAKLSDMDDTLESIEKLAKRIDDPSGEIAAQIKASQKKLLEEIEELRPANLVSLESDIGDLKKLLKDADGGLVGDAKVLTLVEKVSDKVEDLSYQVSKLEGVGGELSTTDMARLAKLVATELADDWSAFKHKMDGELIKLQASLKSVDAENDARYDALLKLNQNQQALATAVDRLRVELQDYSAKSVLASTPHHESKLSEELRELKEMMKVRQDFWSRFRYWLYGTNDWYAASWGRRRAVDLESKSI